MLDNFKYKIGDTVIFNLGTPYDVNTYEGVIVIVRCWLGPLSNSKFYTIDCSNSSLKEVGIYMVHIGETKIIELVIRTRPDLYLERKLDLIL